MQKSIPITISKSDVFPTKKGFFIENEKGKLILTEKSKKFLINSFARINGNAYNIHGGKLALLILSGLISCGFIFTVFDSSLAPLLLVLGLILAGFGFLKNIVMEDAVRIAFSVELQPATGDVEAVETVVIAQTPKKLYRTLIFPTDK